MSKKSRLTEKQKNDIAHLRENCGWSHRRIAQEIGETRKIVEYYCFVNFIDSPNPSGRNNQKRGPAVRLRNGKKVRLFSPAEDRKIQRLRMNGGKVHDIARQMGRAPNSVKMRLIALARKEERKAA